jgi:tetratricopeptide (TPR) repeat protein
MLALLLAGTAGSTWQAVRATHAERQMAAAQSQTREALDTLTDDVVETVFAKQPEPDETEKAFLRKVIGFYEAFTQQSGETAEARFLRARGYFKVAHLRGLLGEPPAAVAGYRQAEALLEQLADQFPNEAEYRQKLARTEGNLGIELAKQRKEAEAETAFRKGIALRTQLAEHFPTERPNRLDLANNTTDLGYLRELQHREAEAEEFYRQAQDLKAQLVAEAGDVPLYHLEWALTRAKMGNLLRIQGKYDESEKAFREALKVQQEQLDKGPTTPRNRNTLAASYHGLGIALAELKREDDAEKVFRQALEIRQKLTADFPRVLEYRRELAGCYSDLGRLLARQGKGAAAEEPYRQALEHRKKMVAQTGPIPQYRQLLAESYHNLGFVLRVTHQLPEAEAALGQALDLWKQLGANMPPNPDLQGGLADTLCELALVHNQRRDFDGAVAFLDEARPHLQAALKARREDSGFLMAQHDYLVALGQSRLGLGDHARPATTAEELAGCGYEPAKDTYDAACLLCGCVTLVGKDGQLAETRRRDLAQGYADRALELLRQAIAAGFKDTARLKDDPDLEPLRAREEFGKLVAKLEGKTKG